MSLFDVIWKDTKGFISSILDWVERELENFWNNGGSLALGKILQLAEDAFQAWLLTTPASAVFSEFEPFAKSYIASNWQPSIGTLESAVVSWAIASTGIKYKIPSAPGLNGGILPGGDSGAVK